jgi:hypothetical protein
MLKVTVSAPVGTLSVLATMDGWESQGRGVFIVTCPEWREDVRSAFGATVLEAEELKVYTEEEIALMVESYADYHGIEPDEVEVTRNFYQDKMVGFRLSRDKDGAHQYGDDEKYGLWN